MIFSVMIPLSVCFRLSLESFLYVFGDRKLYSVLSCNKDKFILVLGAQ